MALRINDTQMMIAKPTDMTADRARDQRLSGYNPEAVRQSAEEAREDLRRIQTTEETDKSRIRPGSEERNAGGGADREAMEMPPEAEEDLHKKAADRFLNLPVDARRQDSETHSFDMSV